MDPIRPQDQPVYRFAHRHLRGFLQQARKLAIMLGIEMLHEHEGHACVWRQPFEQLHERLQSARRGPDPGDRKIRRRFAPTLLASRLHSHDRFSIVYFRPAAKPVCWL